MIFIFRPSCILWWSFIMFRLSAALHFKRVCTWPESLMYYKDTITDNLTHHTHFSSWKNVCSHANLCCDMTCMNDCCPAGHLKFRLQHLMRIDQRLMNERWASSLSIDCLSLRIGCVLDTDSPLKCHAVCSCKRITHSTVPEEEIWHIL